MDKETKYYNALNLLYQSDYPKLKKAKEKFLTWESACQHEKNKLKDADQEWQRLENLNIRLILKEDKTFPPLLKEIAWPPFGIYVLGDISYRQPALAIVGTRNATPLGKELARSFAQGLARTGLTIISGLALGIDESGHRGALDANGKTIAVLGTALDNLYPKQNEGLAKNILESGGAIISEYPLNQEYHPQNFLIRNRLISGLADGVLIIEAPEKSGALATAKFALEQNREVFVVPGNVKAQNYKGSNALIKAGATPVTEPEDLLNYFGISAKTEGDKPAASENSLEENILHALKKENLSIEQLQGDTALSLSALNKNLAMLVIKGIIKESNGKYFIK
ncbi:MAG: DNA-protecting protein DprA [Candidatus Harrisonbacteria bacterium]|nr:DNA-protecting protein DprA [Candidatus Harrisonbacteria bacterium]